MLPQSARARAIYFLLMSTKPSLDSLIKWAETFESTSRWLKRMNKRKSNGQASVNTLRSYFQPMKLFCEYAGLDPDRLVKERENDLGEKSPLARRKAEDRLDAWFAILQKENRAPGSNALFYYAVCSFYKANLMPLVVDVAPKSFPVKRKPTLKKDNLRALLEEAEKPIHKALIFCQAQSGLGISDLLQRRVGEVSKQFEAGAERLHFHLRRIKEEAVEFDSFFGAGSTRMLKAYLEDRKVVDQNECLFPCTSVDSGTRNFDEVLRRLSSKAGLGWYVSSHDLRKFFSNSLKTAHPGDPAFNDSLIEYWMGHSLSRTQGVYTAPPVEDQLRLYILAEPRLDPYS